MPKYNVCKSNYIQRSSNPKKVEKLFSLLENYRNESENMTALVLYGLRVYHNFSEVEVQGLISYFWSSKLYASSKLYKKWVKDYTIDWDTISDEDKKIIKSI